ncbi:LPS O-antigen chain length determinant protein WzzB [Alcaligenes faecalis]|uniref:LPS O-antigen chain length determinant protein WzzB n=1 Tax=Alcaligenes faecalis TaxID=511 RepID=UPI001EF08C4E|nr:Wzz/FepE/Etk N-terminal domain-containing protein [Alcaligenes faecalis]ULH06469.1 Wzz/FepE/Etk N-terminal domain-containing protein [Alcaligenes faecalis]
MGNAVDNRGMAVGRAQHASTSKAYSDEIDLRDLALQLWASRGLIAFAALAVMLCAIVYAFFLAEEVYETRVILLPPKSQHLAAYNLAYQATSGDVELSAGRRHDMARSSNENAIPGVSVETAYAAFQRHLSSMQLREAFFNTHFAADAGNQPASKERYQLWRSMQEAIRIELPGTVKGSPPGQTTLIWKGRDPNQIAHWANLYIEMVMEAASATLIANLNSELDTRLAAVRVQLSILRQSGLAQQQYQVERLREALKIADMIDLEDRLDSPKIWTEDLGDLNYVQGSKALKAQLDTLLARDEIDPFLPEITRLLRWQSLLSNLSEQVVDVGVAEWDAKAQVPAVPVTPRRALIVALGLVLGLMIGVFWALIRQLFGGRGHDEEKQQRCCTSPTLELAQ